MGRSFADRFHDALTKKRHANGLAYYLNFDVVGGQLVLPAHRSPPGAHTISMASGLEAPIRAWLISDRALCPRITVSDFRRLGSRKPVTAKPLELCAWAGDLRGRSLPPCLPFVSYLTLDSVVVLSAGKITIALVPRNCSHAWLCPTQHARTAPQPH